MPELELDIDSHVYRLDGMVIPGCTQVLTAMGATPGFGWLTPDELEFYRSRGHAVHSAVEYAVKGVLDRRTVVDEVKPYLKGWELFCEHRKVEVVDYDFSGEPFVEKQMYHKAFRYGITPDVVAEVDGVFTVIEIKATSAHSDATGLQLAAQVMAVEQTHKRKTEAQRLGLRLLPEHPFYDVKPYTERSDKAVFLGMLNSFNWLSKRKLLKENRNG